MIWVVWWAVWSPWKVNSHSFFFFKLTGLSQKIPAVGPLKKCPVWYRLWRGKTAVQWAGQTTPPRTFAPIPLYFTNIICKGQQNNVVLSLKLAVAEEGKGNRKNELLGEWQKQVRLITKNRECHTPGTQGCGVYLKLRFNQNNRECIISRVLPTTQLPSTEWEVTEGNCQREEDTQRNPQVQMKEKC